MQGNCLRCGAQLTPDAVVCPVCAYGEVEEIVLLEAQRPGGPGPAPDRPSSLPRVLVVLAVLLVVIAVLSAALR